MDKGPKDMKINSISELHHFLGVLKPEHPMISVIKIDDLPGPTFESLRVVINLYGVTFKRNVFEKNKYGQNEYDFDEGIMTLMSPGHIFKNQNYEKFTKMTGWFLLFHPDLIRSYSLAQKIREYNFFSYAVHEALHLSEKEEQIILGIMDNIKKEYLSPIDVYSQDVIVSYLDVLLNYTNRFYNRQFITRKIMNIELLDKLNHLLEEYFEGDFVQQNGLPTVQYFSDKLNLSPNYLSDMLRKLTGESAQKHIHNKLTEKAKDYLVRTSLSVSEISYLLGFEHPQSFSRHFKSKTNQSPIEFRSSFN